MPALFLCGAPHWRWPVAPKPRSIFTPLAAGALMAALLTLGFLGAFGSLINMANTHFFDNVNFSLPLDFPWNLTYIVGIPLLLWIFVFALIFAGQWHRKFFRIYRLLIAG